MCLCAVCKGRGCGVGVGLLRTGVRCLHHLEYTPRSSSWSWAFSQNLFSECLHAFVDPLTHHPTTHTTHRRKDELERAAWSVPRLICLSRSSKHHHHQASSMASSPPRPPHLAGLPSVMPTTKATPFPPPSPSSQSSSSSPPRKTRPGFGKYEITVRFGWGGRDGWWEAGRQGGRGMGERLWVPM